MMKTFKKFVAIMLTCALMISVVPFSAMAEVPEEDMAKIPFSNQLYINYSSSNRDSVQNYGSVLRMDAIGGNYRTFFQLNFSGFEHLLRDEDSELRFSVLPGKKAGSYYYLADFNAYIMADKNDEYGKHYIPYNAGGTPAGMSSDDLVSYGFTYLTANNVANMTPFVQNVNSAAMYSTTQPLVFSANKEVLINALDAAVDDSIVTIHMVRGGAYAGKYQGFEPNSEFNYVEVINAGENATPENYLKLIEDELSWSKLSQDPEKAVVNNVTLPTKYKGVEIEWVSDNPSAISSSGEVTMLESSSQKVTLTANMTYTDYNDKEYKKSVPYSLTVAKIPTEYPVNNSGDATLAIGSKNKGFCAQTIEANGLGGKKAEHDSYIKIADSSGAAYAKPFEGGISGNKDVLEFQFNIPASSKGARIDINFTTYEIESVDSGGNITYDRTTEEFYIYNDGIYTVSKKLIAPIDSEKWYNLALVAPEAGSENADSHIWKLYLNSKFIYNFEWGNTPSGMSYGGIRGTSVDTSDTTIYIDNIKTYSGEFNAQYNQESIAEYEGIDLIGGTLTLTAPTTVGDIKKEMLVDEDADIRIYNEESALMEDSESLTEGCTVVVAAKCGTNMERTYSYYEIRVMESGEFNYDIPFITVEEGKAKGSVKVYNYKGADESYKALLAVYSDGELIEISEAEVFIAENGIPKDFKTTNSVDYESGNTVKFFIWKNDDTNTPVTVRALYK